MNLESRVAEYALKKHPNLFKKKNTIRDGKGKLLRTVYVDQEPIVKVKETHIEVSSHKDASPIILSLTLFN